MTRSIEQLILAYYEYQAIEDATLSWAWDEVHASGFHDPVRKWQQILALLASAPDEHQVGLLGAGALQDLLRMCGADVIELVEAEAAVNPRLRAALALVWPRDSARPANEALTRRIEALVLQAQGER